MKSWTDQQEDKLQEREQKIKNAKEWDQESYGKFMDELSVNSSDKEGKFKQAMSHHQQSW